MISSGVTDSICQVKIAVVRESVGGEHRVSLTPETVAELVEAGHQVHIEAGAGVRADWPDSAYLAAGATVGRLNLHEANLVASIRPLTRQQAHSLKPGTATISFLVPTDHLDVVKVFAAGHITALSFDVLPRVSAAQPIDALTSQAVLAGYRGTIVAGGLYKKSIAEIRTAAMNVPAAKVLVLGAGVAGLQAMSTFARLGAQVTGWDFRPQAPEEIRSVGAHPLELDIEPVDEFAAQTRQLSDTQLSRIQDRLLGDIIESDIVLTAAWTAGYIPPVLVTRHMAEEMRPGSVAVDLASEFGGNIAGSRLGEVVVTKHVKIWGGSQVPTQLAGTASELLSRHVGNVIEGLARLDLRLGDDLTDPLLSAACVTHAGTVRHQRTRDLLDRSQR